MEACKAAKVESPTKTTTTTTTTTAKPASSSCKTTDGKACKFPFQDWDGNKQTKCIDDYGTKVCGTELYSDGYPSAWGNCAAGCP